MKVFYATRAARFDLYRAVAGLSRHITKWTVDCDRKLHRLMNYIYSTLNDKMTGWVGNSPEDVDLHCYPDANYGKDAGNLRQASNYKPREATLVFPSQRQTTHTKL